MLYDLLTIMNFLGVALLQTKDVCNDFFINDDVILSSEDNKYTAKSKPLTKFVCVLIKSRKTKQIKTKYNNM